MSYLLPLRGIPAPEMFARGNSRSAPLTRPPTTTRQALRREFR